MDACGGLGITALSMACRYGHIELAAMLIDYGANVNYESVRGSVPLIEAARGNHMDLVSMLLSREALVGRKNKHLMTAADWALKAGHKYGIAFLGCLLTACSLEELVVSVASALPPPWLRLCAYPAGRWQGS